MVKESGTLTDTASRRVLLAPLDWGLGHATRCVPIIKVLQNKGVEVIIAADGNVAALLAAEFPDIRILPLPGYRIKYSGSRSFFLAGLLCRVPGAVINAIRSRRLVKKWVRESGISTVISDNRPELFNCGVKSIYITHQLDVKTGNRHLDPVASAIHRYFIGRFSECWVPDEEGEDNLAGELSHPAKIPSAKVRYIGCISRFTAIDRPVKEYDISVILSGPEPQRSVLEKKVVRQLEKTNLRAAVVRGLPGGDEMKSVNPGIRFFNHLPSAQLNEMIASSSLILARCGYSTVMDLALSGKKALLIPTPGQGEQEYLAGHLTRKKIFFTTTQDKLDLQEDIKAAYSFECRFPEIAGLDEEKITASIQQA